MRCLAVLACVASTSMVCVADADVPEADHYRMDHFRAPVPESLKGARVMHTAELSRLIALGRPVLIDVLPAPVPPADGRPGLPRMPLAHRDLPGSVWLPDTGRGALPPAVDSWFQSKLRAATDGAYKRPLVFYCLSKCWMSWNAAKRALAYGYTDVIWYPDGADGWGAAGLPTDAAVPQHP